MDKTQEENEERVAEEYLSSLSDLNCNSKPLINMLTMLAEENIEYAPIIVKVVEQHIAKVPPDIKLPLLYLIDSIVKNVKSTYVQLFSQCIVNIFCNVFEKVNEKIRERMYALRQTWNEVFSPQKLYALDVKVKSIDNNWPITAKQPQPSIHVNPNFLKSVGAVRGGDVEEILQAKTRELLELRKRKLELELEATKKHLEEQEKQLSKTADGVIAPVKSLVDSNTLSGLHVQPVPPQIVPGMVAPGLISAHHINTSTPVGVVSGAIAQKLYHHNFRNPRPHTQPHVPPGMMTIPPLNFQPVTTVGKPKVHPVNPALLNIVRHRDPRLARQQQQQQSSNNRSMQIHSIRNDSHAEGDGKTDGKSILSYRNGNSKNYRGASGSTDDIVVVENKSSGRHSSNSSRFTGHLSKSCLSRDKEKDRKRSESKSSTTSSSSVGSSSSERRKGSSSNRGKKTVEKCDKDAFEIAPLSTAFKRKSLSPSSSSIKKKELKRISKSQSHSQNKYRSRSRSPTDIATKDVDLRLRSSPSYSPKKHRKSSLSDSEPEEEEQNTTNTTTGLENKKHAAKASVNVETSKVSKRTVVASEAENDDHDVIMDVSERPVKKSIDRVSEEYNDDKKRILTISESEEPLAKKSKSAKLDALFGDEDVDLRTVMPPQILVTQQQSTIATVSPPPPPVITELQEKGGENWTKVSPSNAEKSSPKKSANLEDVRAKLAKATKYNKIGKNDKFGKDLSHRFKLDELNVCEDSQEANDEKIRTIIAQAQELLETNSINQEQYKNLIQKVMSINESSKLKEAKRRESLNNVARVKQLTEVETASSSIDAERSAARDAILRKRIPKLPRSQQTAGESTISESNLVANNNSNSPVHSDRNNSNDHDVGAQKAKHGKEKRSKPSKWGERVEPTHANTSGVSNAVNIQKGWLKGSAIKHASGGFRGMVPIATPPNPNMPPQQIPWQIGPNISPNPFINPISIAMGGVSTPPNPSNMQAMAAPPSIPKPCNSIDNPQADLVRTITIDGLSKEIRIYDQVAIVFMELDQPREIGFQIGQRSVIIDNEEPITLQFNDDYKAFPINGEPHRLRFGFPSRELYIDEHWYEIYFGGPPVSIPINNKMHILKAEGPPPQVNIGALRRDLVVGKINMIVDAHIVIPLFLDAKIQTFRLRENEHTVQFADNLLTVLLDGEVVNVEFGGLPKSYMLRGIQYFIRFGALPQGVIAGKIRIKDMIYVKTEPLVEHATANSPKPFISTVENVVQFPSPSSIENIEVKQIPSKIEQPTLTEIQTASSTVGTGSGTSIPIIPAAALSNINIDELFQKLVSSGILSGTTPAPNKAVGVLPTPSAAVVIPEESIQPVATIQPIDLTKSETIKTRQAAIVNTLFSGMQCSSCGVRFPPEQTIKYSQHLDWHFRQNRRERDSSRRAHSRKWYYDLTDWIQYEEIEDLEEREKNFFETQLNEVDTNDEASNQRWVNSPVLSCPAMPEDVDRACDMCHEKFEQFYNEELEEWHLRSAIRVDDKIYHPLCYEDYKMSLNPTVSQAKDEVVITEDDNAVDAVIKIEVDDKSEETKTLVKDNDNNEDDDDDVIMLPNEEPSVTEIDDDDEYVPVNVTREEMGELSTDDKSEEGGMTDNAGSDVEIQEPHIPFTDLDTYVEKPQSEGDESSQKSFMNVKIKEEPKDDDDDEDDGFEDVGTVLIAPEEEISIQSSEETQTQTIASSVSTASPVTDIPPSSTSLVQLDASEFSEAAATKHSAPIDGNLGTADERILSSVGPTPAIPLASLVNKIKINIAKNSASTNHSSSSSSNSTSTLATSSTTITTNTSTSIPCVNYNLNEANAVSTDQKHALSAITVVSTIPVLCGGGTMGATRTTIATSSGSGGSSTSASESPNVSTISVIGSYGNSSNSSRHYMEPISVASTPRLRTPPIEDAITYELKPSLQKVALTRAKKVECGVETSGLCSVM